MEQIKLDEYVINSLTDYGRGVNSERQLASLYDGLKVVYRRVVYTAMQIASNKLMKTAAIAGNVIATVHPHSSDSVADVIAQLVRWGILEGQGNFGIKLIYGANIRASAPRYTEAKVDSKWTKIFGELLPYVPYKEAEMEGNMEPEYLPTPLPMILLFSGQGIGYGVNARYPMFTAKSLYKAYMKNNPNLLESPNDLTIINSESDLKDLWEKGIGKITYSYKVEKQFLDSGDGVMVSGSAELFKPDFEIEFNEELNKGQIYILDQTSSDIPKVFIGRSPYVRAITQDDIFDRCKKICKYTRFFRLTVTSNNTAYVIPLKDWIDETYCNYHNLIEEYQSDKIKKLTHEKLIYNFLPLVTSILLDHRDWNDDQIIKKISDKDCDSDIVKAILRKSINTLRNTDSEAKIKEIDNSINEFNNLNPDKYIENIINEF